MSDRLKMGLIGCGGMSGAHMRAIKNSGRRGSSPLTLLLPATLTPAVPKSGPTQAHEFQGRYRTGGLHGCGRDAL